MKAHLISDKIYYLSLEQNNYIFEMKQSMKNTYDEMEESQINAVVKYLKEEEDSYYIIDASNVQLKFSIENIEDIICERFAILGINKDIFDVICKRAGNRKIETSYRKYNIPVKNDKNKEDYYIVLFSTDNTNTLWNYVNKNIIKLKDQENIRGFIDLKCMRNIIAVMLKNDIKNYNDNKWTYLESSNVYIKNYLNIKCLFAVPDVFDLVILKMRQLIKKVFIDGKSIKERGEICLLGVSNNGIILSRILAYIMEMNSESINHLGPTYCMEGEIEDLARFKNRQYILISDVICLGGEYRMTKGIVKVRDVYRNEKKDDNTAIAVLEEIEQYGIKYEIYIDEEESKDGYKLQNYKQIKGTE